MKSSRFRERIDRRFKWWRANHETFIASRKGMPFEHTWHYFHLLILELQGEMSPAAFNRCIAKAFSQYRRDFAPAIQSLESPQEPNPGAQGGQSS